jgi:hypothetical protein
MFRNLNRIKEKLQQMAVYQLENPDTGAGRFA